MSRKLKLNVKNVTLGCNNFGDILARNDYRILSGFSPSAGPKAIALNKPECDFYKQDYVKSSTLKYAEAAFPRSLDKISLKRSSSEIPVIGKWLDEVQSSPIYTPVWGLPWKSNSFYYDRKNPNSPTSGIETELHCEKAFVKPIRLLPLCPPCPLKPEKSNPCANTLCTLKTVIFNNCRLYCASPCQPKPPKKKNPAENRCEPKFKIGKSSGASSGGDPCAGGKREIKTDCYGSDSKGSGSGGDPCAGGKEVKKNCYGSDSKGSGSKKGPVCPSPKCK